MSQTAPADVVRRSYWAYVASAMAEGLGQILNHEATSTAIPRRVYVDASEFFRLALEAAGDALPANPSASISNYIIAADAASALPARPDSRAALRTRLEEYAALLSKLQGGTPVSDDDESTAAGLRDFFVKVQQEAEAETYDQVVRLDLPALSRRCQMKP